jgi:hypothetical protein
MIGSSRTSLLYCKKLTSFNLDLRFKDFFGLKSSLNLSCEFLIDSIKERKGCFIKSVVYFLLINIVYLLSFYVLFLISCSCKY